MWCSTAVVNTPYIYGCPHYAARPFPSNANRRATPVCSEPPTLPASVSTLVYSSRFVCLPRSMFVSISKINYNSHSKQNPFPRRSTSLIFCSSGQLHTPPSGPPAPINRPATAQITETQNIMKLVQAATCWIRNEGPSVPRLPCMSVVWLVRHFNCRSFYHLNRKVAIGWLNNNDLHSEGRVFKSRSADQQHWLISPQFLYKFRDSPLIQATTASP